MELPCFGMLDSTPYLFNAGLTQSFNQRFDQWKRRVLISILTDAFALNLIGSKRSLESSLGTGQIDVKSVQNLAAGTGLTPRIGVARMIEWSIGTS
jgi:hypothetical protein